MKPVTHRIVTFPRSRLATFDIGALGRKKHYVSALLELDVTEARRRIREARRSGGGAVSFTGWLLQTIAQTVREHPEVAAFRLGRRKLMLFSRVNVSLLVEKEVEGRKVPLPLLIREADEKSAAQISAEIEEARKKTAASGQAVLGGNPNPTQAVYYLLPGALRRLAWRIMLKRPRFLFARMGNVVVTAVGMMGRVNGWFLQTSVHPLSVGIGSVTRKPVAAGAEVRVAEILHATVLLDHDAVDGAPMARFVAALASNVEAARGL